MKNNKFPILKQIMAGTLGGIIGAVIGFLTLMIYGGNFGCFSFVDSIFQLQGYESCGNFGGIIGLFLGILLGVLFAHKMISRGGRVFRRFKFIFILLWLAALLVTFGFIYSKNAREADQQLATREAQIQTLMADSGLIDLSVPIEIDELNQSTEKLEVFFVQGEYELTVRLITGDAAEKWVLDLETKNPESENANVISFIYPSEWGAHMGLITSFDYEKSVELSEPKTAEKNVFLAIEGLRILEQDPRLMEAFRSKVEELRSSLMVGIRDDFIASEPTQIQKFELVSH